jgi:pimeloyl-ACP methyl ester carboxylesterase
MPLSDARRPHTAASLPTVVALHSSASGPRQWVAYASALAGRAVLETPALLGYDQTARWSPQDAVSLDVEAERLWLQLPSGREAVHLVGHSYGAAVALAMARFWPQRVHSLTLYEPIPFALLRQDADGGPWREIHGLATEVALWVRLGQPERAAERFVNYWGDASSWAGMPQRRRDAVTLRMSKVCREFDALFDDPTPAAALTLLDMPVRVLCGAESPLPARRTSQRVAGLCPRAELCWLPGLGHMGPVDRPEIVMSLLPWATGHRAHAEALVSSL